MKGTEEGSFLPFAFCLIILPHNGLHGLCFVFFPRSMVCVYKAYLLVPRN